MEDQVPVPLSALSSLTFGMKTGLRQTPNKSDFFLHSPMLLLLFSKPQCCSHWRPCLPHAAKLSLKLVTPLLLLALPVAQHMQNCLKFSSGPSWTMLRTSRASGWLFTSRTKPASSHHEPNHSQALIRAGKPHKQFQLESLCKQLQRLGKCLMPGELSTRRIWLDCPFFMLFEETCI